ncbi:hypothetical protein DFH94DRAFT_679925 [Russula ochroleuca]|uniref:Uncharacterized protein n=1 Tax=Russula ochroleuca TaxID=152965 RepID=A0A9P5TB94_9AGAM|nr:hypothetical protein DFH94DRAFT_679925 [Russula ochroleuca]
MTTVLCSLSLHTLSCHLIAAHFPAHSLNRWQPLLPPKPRMQWWCMHGQLSHVVGPSLQPSPKLCKYGPCSQPCEGIAQETMTEENVTGPFLQPVLNSKALTVLRVLEKHQTIILHLPASQPDPAHTSDTVSSAVSAPIMPDVNLSTLPDINLSTLPITTPLMCSKGKCKAKN